MKPNFNPVFFDLDGTLTDPFEGITKSIQYSLRHAGIDEPDLHKLEKCIGPPLLSSFMTFYGFSRQQAEKSVQTYREQFEKWGIYQNKVIEGMPSLLAKLQNAQIRLGVISVKPKIYVDKILRHFHLIDYFELTLGDSLTGGYNDKKVMIRDALETMKMPARKAVMIGDRYHDIRGAKGAGISSIGVLFGYGSKEELTQEGADILCEDVGQLTKCLLDE